MTRSIRLVAGSSSPVLRAGYETKMNVEKHECSLSLVSSDGSSTPTASTTSKHLIFQTLNNSGRKLGWFL
jgi:hypothetical protein